jgi:hypothetical protein
VDDDDAFKNAQQALLNEKPKDPEHVEWPSAL